jgi:hypothetical protein
VLLTAIPLPSPSAVWLVMNGKDATDAADSVGINDAAATPTGRSPEQLDEM